MQIFARRRQSSCLDTACFRIQYSFVAAVDVCMHAVHLQLLLHKVLLQLLELSMRESVFVCLIVFSSIGQQVHCASTVSAALLAVCT